MKWTRDTPALPGWYWRRARLVTEWYSEVAHVQQDFDQEGYPLVVKNDRGVPERVETIRGWQWAGPIPRPD